MGQLLGPQLGAFLATARKHWDVAQADKASSKVYGDAVDVCEKLLKVIDPQVRGEGKSPKSELKPAWDKPDPERYEADLKAWLTVVGQSPYASKR
jgi:hypothetical protein